jgi:hypothetical protein
VGKFSARNFIRIQLIGVIASAFFFMHQPNIALSAENDWIRTFETISTIEFTGKVHFNIQLFIR